MRRRSVTPTLPPSKRVRGLSTIDEIIHHMRETPEDRLKRADKYGQWVERKPGTLKKRDSFICRGCYKDLTTQDTTYRLKGTPALVICDGCIHASATKTGIFDDALCDSFEMTRQLIPLINARISNKATRSQ